MQKCGLNEYENFGLEESVFHNQLIFTNYSAGKKTIVNFTFWTLKVMTIKILRQNYRYPYDIIYTLNREYTLNQVGNFVFISFRAMH